MHRLATLHKAVAVVAVETSRCTPGLIERRLAVEASASAVVVVDKQRCQESARPSPADNPKYQLVVVGASIAVVAATSRFSISLQSFFFFKVSGKEKREFPVVVRIKRRSEMRGTIYLESLRSYSTENLERRILV